MKQLLSKNVNFGVGSILFYNLVVRFTMSKADVLEGLKEVQCKIEVASAKRPQELQYFQPRLVAVSKTKPKELIIAAYEHGQRHFGENYIQELLEKSQDPEVVDRCREIHWHFIGHLQRNKVNKLMTVPSLYMVETIDSIKLASALNAAWGKLMVTKLNVMVQINTSGEKEKNGVIPDAATEVVRYVMHNCTSLKLAGLMTIGEYGYDLSQGPNPDFQCLVRCREAVAKDLGLDIKNLELSMGMSSDYEHAIELGSASVRIGTSIFGERQKKHVSPTVLAEEAINELRIT